MEMTIGKAMFSQISEYFDQLDPAFLSKLWKRVDRQDYLQKISALATSFEAWQDARLVGLVSVYTNRIEDGVAYITHVGIIPAFRGRGIAKRLLMAACSYVKQIGFDRIVLEVDANNLEAITLYRKLGFLPVSSKNNMLQLELKK